MQLLCTPSTVDHSVYLEQIHLSLPPLTTIFEAWHRSDCKEAMDILNLREQRLGSQLFRVRACVCSTRSRRSSWTICIRECTGMKPLKVLRKHKHYCQRMCWSRKPFRWKCPGCCCYGVVSVNRRLTWVKGVLWLHHLVCHSVQPRTVRSIHPPAVLKKNLR